LSVARTGEKVLACKIYEEATTLIESVREGDQTALDAAIAVFDPSNKQREVKIEIVYTISEQQSSIFMNFQPVRPSISPIRPAFRPSRYKFGERTLETKGTIESCVVRSKLSAIPAPARLTPTIITIIS